MITKDDYTIINKDGTSVDPQLEDKMKNIVQEFINHPKFEAYSEKKLYECFIYGEVTYSDDDLEKLYKEMTCYYNDGLYCKKSIKGTKCSLDSCVAWKSNNHSTTQDR